MTAAASEPGGRGSAVARLQSPAWLLGLLALWLLATLRPLLQPDEERYASVARLGFFSLPSSKLIAWQARKSNRPAAQTQDVAGRAGITRVFADANTESRRARN